MDKYNRYWGTYEVPKEIVPARAGGKEQVGGSHYSDMAIQPIDYIVANAIPYLDGNVVKYISRHRSKNGAEDVRKAIHYCEMILRTEYPND